MKKLYLLAAAALTLAACTDEAYLGENKEFTKTDNPIGFNMSTPAMSRADITGKDAADKLDKAFFVDAIKNEKNNIGTIVQGNANDVMDNYKVTYADNSAFTTTSNTEGWEYVGNVFTDKETANVTPNNAGTGPTAEPQTIKYWDWGAADYTFTAISALGTDITNDYVKIVKNRTANPTDAYKNGYTLTINQKATFSKIYIADRVNIVKPTDSTDPTNPATTDPKRTDHNVYGGQVNFKFRNLGTQVRAAMYETVPGYTVTVNKMYDGESTQGSSSANFVAACPNTTIAEGKSIEATVTYIAPTTSDPDPNKDVVNHPTVTFANPSGVTDALKSNTTLTLGTNIFAKSGDPAVQNPLLTTSAAPTYDTQDGAYTFVLPQEKNDKDMKVKVDYTLKCDATGEVIKVVGATATVPAEYLQWKPNFSYTYLFKISDNTNGQTDPGTSPIGPEGLYPITFDAVVVDAGDGIAEYITTVSEPSITTFGYNSTTKKYVADAKAYETGTDIFATVMTKTGTAPETITTTGATAGNVNVYSITCDDASYVTEAAVAEYLAENAAGNITGTAKLTAAPYYTGVSFVTKVPAEDGTETTANALKMAGAAAGTYAVEYIVTAATGTPYVEETLTSGASLAGYYLKGADTYTKCGENDKAVAGVTYYTYDSSTGYAQVTTALTPGETSVKDYYTFASSTYTKCTAEKVTDPDITNGVKFYKKNAEYKPAKAQYKVFTVSTPVTPAP